MSNLKNSIFSGLAFGIFMGIFFAISNGIHYAIFIGPLSGLFFGLGIYFFITSKTIKQQTEIKSVKVFLYGFKQFLTVKQGL